MRHHGSVTVDNEIWAWIAVSIATSEGTDPFHDSDRMFLSFYDPTDPDQRLKLSETIPVPESGDLTEEFLHSVIHQADGRIWQTDDAEYWEVTHHTGTRVGTDVRPPNLPDPHLTFERYDEDGGPYNLRKGITSLVALDRRELDGLLRQACS